MKLGFVEFKTLTLPPKKNLSFVRLKIEDLFKEKELEVRMNEIIIRWCPRTSIMVAPVSLF